MTVQRIVLGRVLAAALFLAAALNVSAQGTAISYQGQLSDGGAPANTNYDFRFAVFNALTNGTQVSLWLTNALVPVSNGLFSVTLNFGPGVFNGTSNGSNDWMDVAVRKSGTTNFTELVPRQPILPVPYALFATSTSNLLGTLQATQLVGTIGSSVFAGTYSNGVNFLNGTNNFNGTFAGNGTSLTNLNASNLISGTVADARLTANVALLNANQTFTGTNTFSSPITFNNRDVFNGSNSFTAGNSFSGPNTFSGVNTFNNNGNTFNGSFFGNGLVGWTAISGTSVTATRDAGYMLLNASLTTLTLPASLTAVDIVRVSGAGAGGWKVQQINGQSITGNFAKYANSFLAGLSNSPTANGYGIAASADGARMYVVGAADSAVYASSDSGRSWITLGLTGFWTSIACSADGKTVYAQPGSGLIRKSTDAGATWGSTTTSATGSFISCTADGSTLITGSVACSGNGLYRARLSGGAIQVSLNGGSFNSIAAAPAANLFCLGASSDCSRLVAGVSNGLLYASSNMGATWTTLSTISQNWSSAWMSPDGSKFAATVSYTGGPDGGVYTCTVSPQPNTTSTTSTGSICGSQGSAVELQYVGGGLFMPVSSSGLLWAN